MSTKSSSGKHIDHTLTRLVINGGASNALDVTGGATVSSALSAGSVSTTGALSAGSMSITGALSAGTLTSTGVLISKYATAAGSDSGVTIPAGTSVFGLTAGGSVPFALTGPSGVAGQLLIVRNDSGQATTGLVTATGGGAVFVHDGSSFVQVAAT